MIPENFFVFTANTLSSLWITQALQKDRAQLCKYYYCSSVLVYNIYYSMRNNKCLARGKLKIHSIMKMEKIQFTDHISVNPAIASFYSIQSPTVFRTSIRNDKAFEVKKVPHLLIYSGKISVSPCSSLNPTVVVNQMLNCSSHKQESKWMKILHHGCLRGH